MWLAKTHFLGNRRKVRNFSFLWKMFFQHRLADNCGSKTQISWSIVIFMSFEELEKCVTPQKLSKVRNYSHSGKSKLRNSMQNQWSRSL